MERKEGRHHDATGREKKHQSTSTENKNTQQKLISHAQTARCNQDQDARPPPNTTPAAPRRAQRRNAQSNGKTNKNTAVCEATQW
jgi:hypothetical protein